LICNDCRRATAMGPSWELSAESRAVAAEMSRKPVAQLTGSWDRDTASDLRRFLVQQIESHAERRLMTAGMLEQV
jgi:hypothetical protein